MRGLLPLIFGIVVALSAPGHADQTLGPGRVVDSTNDVLFGPLKIGKRVTGRTELDISGNIVAPNLAAPNDTLAKWLANPSLNTTNQLAQFSVSKVVSGAPAGGGSHSGYNAFMVGMINDVQQADNDTDVFAFNGALYSGVLYVGVSTPARGSVAAYQGAVHVYDYADAPSGRLGGEPTGLALVLNATTNGDNGSLNYWFADKIAHGPAKDFANREGLFVGDNLVMAKFSPGNTVDTTTPRQYKLGSAGRSLQTAPGIASNVKTRPGDSWTGQTAYTIGFGHIVMGYGGLYGTATNGDHPAAIEGWDVAYQSGGWGPAYLNPATGQPGKSKIGIGFKSLDHTGAAFRAGARHGVGTGKAFVADIDAGPSEFNSPTTLSGAATFNAAATFAAAVSFGGAVSFTADHSITKAMPVRTMTATNATAGNRVFREVVSGESYLIQINDEVGTIATAWQIDRSGGTVTKLSAGAVLNAPSFSVNNVAGYTGTKTVGSCNLVMSGGLITNVTGC